jgi:hypothetical protein
VGHQLRRPMIPLAMGRPVKNVLILGVIIASLISSSLPVSAELPICRASTCSGAEENCSKYRKEHGISPSELPCEKYGAACRSTGVFPGDQYSEFPNGCRVLGRQ